MTYLRGTQVLPTAHQRVVQDVPPDGRHRRHRRPAAATATGVTPPCGP